MALDLKFDSDETESLIYMDNAYCDDLNFESVCPSQCDNKKWNYIEGDWRSGSWKEEESITITESKFRPMTYIIS